MKPAFLPSFFNNMTSNILSNDILKILLRYSELAHKPNPLKCVECHVLCWVVHWTYRFAIICSTPTALWTYLQCLAPRLTTLRSKTLVLNQEEFCFPENIWQCLDTLLSQLGESYRHLGARPGHTTHPAMHRTRPRRVIRGVHSAGSWKTLL